MLKSLGVLAGNGFGSLSRVDSGSFMSVPKIAYEMHHEVNFFHLFFSFGIPDTVR